MDEDVTKLTDEELDKKVEAEVNGEVAESPDTTTTTKEEAEPNQEPEEEQPEPAVAEETKEEERPPSRREQLRIRQILDKREAANRPQTPSQPNREDAINYQEALDADPAVIARLEADRQAEAQAQYTAGLNQAKAIEFKTNIRLDLPLVKEKLEKLDRADVEALDREYLQTVGFDPATGFVRSPDIGYADFIEARIEQAERLAASMTAQTTQNIAKQAAQTGLRPDGSAAKYFNINNNPEDMTDEELDAVLASGGLATKKRR